jgi:hypothetical protein
MNRRTSLGKATLVNTYHTSVRVIPTASLPLICCDNPSIEANGILNARNLPTRLKGIAIGNGWIDPITQYPAYIEFAVKEKLLTKGSTEYNQAVAALETCRKAMNTTELTPHIGACELLMGKAVDHLQSTLVPFVLTLSVRGLW